MTENQQQQQRRRPSRKNSFHKEKDQQQQDLSILDDRNNNKKHTRKHHQRRKRKRNTSKRRHNNNSCHYYLLLLLNNHHNHHHSRFIGFVLISIVIIILWSLYLFGHISSSLSSSTLSTSHTTTNDYYDIDGSNGGRGLLEPIFVQTGHIEECFQVNNNNTTNDTNNNKKQQQQQQRKQQPPTGLVVTVLSFDKNNPQLWNSICTLFPSQLTHFIVPHQLDVFLLLYGNNNNNNNNNVNIEQELVNCMNLQPSSSQQTTTWHNMDGSITKTRNYYATTVISGIPYKTTIKIAVQSDMDIPLYVVEKQQQQQLNNMMPKSKPNLTSYLEENPIEPPMCQAPIPYIQGTRWYTNQLLHLNLLQDYEYFIKLDPDVVFIEPLKFNILYDMKRQNAIFGHTGEYPPGIPTPCSDGINTAIQEYIKHNNNTPPCSIPQTPIPNSDRYYTNFIIGSTRFFQSSGVQNLGRWLSEYPYGFFKHRWTDQFFWHIAIQLYYLPQQQQSNNKYNNIVDYTEFRCYPIKNCWPTALEMKLYSNYDTCHDNGNGIFVHTKHAKHWAHRWNRYHTHQPYDVTEQQFQPIYKSTYQHDCYGTRWEGISNSNSNSNSNGAKKMMMRGQQSRIKQQRKSPLLFV